MTSHSVALPKNLMQTAVNPVFASSATDRTGTIFAWDNLPRILASRPPSRATFKTTVRSPSAGSVAKNTRPNAPWPSSSCSRNPRNVSPGFGQGTVSANAAKSSSPANSSWTSSNRSSDLRYVGNRSQNVLGANVRRLQAQAIFFVGQIQYAALLDRQFGMFPQNGMRVGGLPATPAIDEIRDGVAVRVHELAVRRVTRQRSEHRADSRRLQPHEPIDHFSGGAFVDVELLGDFRKSRPREAEPDDLLVPRRLSGNQTIPDLAGDGDFLGGRAQGRDADRNRRSNRPTAARG